MPGGSGTMTPETVKAVTKALECSPSKNAANSHPTFKKGGGKKK